LYAQEDSTTEVLQQSCPPGTGPDPDGGCSPLPDEAIEESPPGGTDLTPQASDNEPEFVPESVPGVTPQASDNEPEFVPESVPGVTPQASDNEREFVPESVPGVTPPVPGKPVDVPGVDFPDINFPNVKRMIEEPAKEITGSLENTISIINPNIPVSTLMIVGVVAVVAIGAGVASFSRHHHGRSSTSHSSLDQTHQDDTEEEQIYEDVQIVTQGGIEEV
jgi:hypothetical protein